MAAGPQKVGQNDYFSPKWMVLICIFGALIFSGPCYSIRCFSGTVCSGSTVDVMSSTSETNQINECCLSSQGFSYNDSQQCLDCLVYGFFPNTDLVNGLPEREEPYNIQVGYFKGSGPRFRATVRPLSSGTAVLDVDYSLGSSIVVAGVMSEVTITFRPDFLAQEGRESVHLQMTGTVISGIPSNSIFKDTLQMQILDNDEVTIAFTEEDYRAVESELSIPVVVTKDRRLANPVTVQVSPRTISCSLGSGLPIPEYVPPDDNPFSPNQAKIWPPERQDFSPNVITVTFPADEFQIGPFVVDRDVPVPITDDDIDEAGEEYFLLFLTLDNENITDPDKVVLSSLRQSHLCIIVDDDEIHIGFTDSSYTFTEPSSESVEMVYLEKENGQISEQTFLIILQAFPVLVDAAFDPATLDEDFAIGGSFLLLTFMPSNQSLQVNVTLLADKNVERTEAFSFLSTAFQDSPRYSPPLNLYRSTLIAIEDDDLFVIGFEQNYTTTENSSLEVCVRVFEPSEEYRISYPIELAADTIEGTAGNLDYIPIRSVDQFEPIATLDDNTRRACFTITINGDDISEGSEQFSIVLSLATTLRSILNGIPDRVVINPNRTYVDIEGITCTDLTLPPSGTITYSAGSLNARPINRTVATYDCGTGYNLIGEKTRLCQSDATWSGMADCEVVSCGTPPTVLYAMTGSPSTVTYEGTVTYTCDDDYALASESPNATITCLANGNWSTLPSCILIDCGIPPTIPNGFPGTPTKTTRGGIVLYNCENGYRVSAQSDSATCTVIGTWTSVPVCSIVSCGSPPAIANGSPGTPNTATFGGIVQYSCDDGHTFIATSDTMLNVSCLATGSWMVPPECVPDVDCGEPPMISNGTGGTPTFTTFGGTILYRCNEGFSISELTLVSCTASGQWKRVPTCTAIHCPELMHPPNGQVRSSKPGLDPTIGTTVTYDCNPGVFLVGPVERTCTQVNDTSTTGVWSGTESLCVFRCEALPLLEEGRIVFTPESNVLPNYDLETVASYICNPGFSLSAGNTTRTCMETNHTAIWSGENEVYTCVTSNLAQNDLIISLGAAMTVVVILLLLMIIVTVIVLVYIRRRSKFNNLDEPMSYEVDGHIYEDPNVLLQALPSLPNRNIPMSDNKAYDKAFEMMDNNAYHRGDSEAVTDGEVRSQMSNDDGYVNIEPDGSQMKEGDQTSTTKTKPKMPERKFDETRLDCSVDESDPCACPTDQVACDLSEGESQGKSIKGPTVAAMPHNT